LRVGVARGEDVGGHYCGVVAVVKGAYIGSKASDLIVCRSVWQVGDVVVRVEE
jgi:hypothetical protein